MRNGASAPYSVARGVMLASLAPIPITSLFIALEEG